jgi:hypothetical protein
LFHRDGRERSGIAPQALGSKRFLGENPVNWPRPSAAPEFMPARCTPQENSGFYQEATYGRDSRSCGQAGLTRKYF